MSHRDLLQPKIGGGRRCGDQQHTRAEGATRSEGESWLTRPVLGPRSSGQTLAVRRPVRTKVEATPGWELHRVRGVPFEPCLHPRGTRGNPR